MSWGDDGQFLGWYVNLEEPWWRSALGFDATDHLLNIVIRPDRRWRWKDEAHLAEAVDVGLFAREKGRAIREEGERAIARIEAWGAPFHEGWESWRPDPGWPLPEVVSGWQEV